MTLTAGLPVFVWDGGGADANWTTAANWNTDQAPFASVRFVFPEAAAQKTNTNDFPAGTLFDSFDLQGSGYDIDGNAVVLAAGIVATGDMVVTTKVAVPLSFSARPPSIGTAKSSRTSSAR